MFSVAIIIKESPYGDYSAFEALKLALGFAHTNINVTVIFIEEGGFCCIKNQNPKDINRDNILDIIEAIRESEANLFIHKNSMEIHNIFDNEIINIQCIDDNNLEKIINQVNTVLWF